MTNSFNSPVFEALHGAPEAGDLLSRAGVPTATSDDLRLFVTMEGGLVTSICSPNPEMFKNVQVFVLDYDTEGADPDTLVRVAQCSDVTPGAELEAVMVAWDVTKAGISLKGPV